jgi:hypothetical protein
MMAKTNWQMGDIVQPDDLNQIGQEINDAAAAAAAAQAMAENHASRHTENGADPIPNATPMEGGLMSGTDKAKLDAATSAATPNTIVQRDANGRAKVAAPAASDDIATKGYADATFLPQAGGDVVGRLSAIGYDMPDSSGPAADLTDIPDTRHYVARVINRTGYPQTHGSIIGYKSSPNNYQYSWQIFHGATSQRMYRRYALSSSTWSSWEEVITSAGGQTINNTLSFSGTFPIRLDLPGYKSWIIHRAENYISFAPRNDSDTNWDWANSIVFTPDGRISFGAYYPAKPTIFMGNGSPEGSKTAVVGSLYLRTDGGAGTSLYVKVSGTGNTGWKAVQTA